MAQIDLSRFHEAQKPVLNQVNAELEAGRKASHWMWFIFPQLAGLGRSSTAKYFGIADLMEAKAYLADPVLGARLRQHVRLMLRHGQRSAFDILGSPDELKFRSCLTLFREAASDVADKALFQEALDVFYGGEADQATKSLLEASGG